MILVYAPDGNPEQRWEFQLGKLRVKETEAIEKRTGVPYGAEFKENLLKGQVTARRALLWTMLRRAHHNLRYEDVDFADDEVVLEFDRGEWQEMYDGVAAAAGLADEDKEFRLALIGAEIAKLDADTDAKAEEGEYGGGKAPLPNSASVTGSP